MSAFRNDIWYPLYDAWHRHATLRAGAWLVLAALVLWYRRPLWRFLLQGWGAR